MRNLDYISIDLFSPRAMVRMDVENIEFPDNCFDCIICYHVLEHVPGDRKAMAELFRVLKPGGWAIIQVPIQREITLEDPNAITNADRLRIYGQEDHVRSYGLDYKERLEEAGFFVTLDDFYKKMRIEMVEKHGLAGNLESEHIYYCEKLTGIFVEEGT